MDGVRVAVYALVLSGPVWAVSAVLMWWEYLL